MPSIIRHQALAACIPRSLSDNKKDLFLSYITRFNVDQSMAISRTKPSLEEAIKSHANTVRVAHEGKYPREEMRLAIFRLYNWSNSYSELAEYAKELSKKNDSLQVLILILLFLRDADDLRNIAPISPEPSGKCVRL